MSERHRDNVKTAILLAVLTLIVYGLACCAFGTKI